jgi:hypothetical protein
MRLGNRARHIALIGPPALALCIFAAPLRAQNQQPAPTAGDTSVSVGEAPAEKPRSRFREMFFDETDGKLDLSETLARGGFIPMPVIITEPAVDGGFGIMAQFVTIPQDNPRHVTRRIAGAVKTGNDSHGYGYFQSGYALDGKISYKFGVGRGKINLEARPGFAPSGVNYTNKYDYGVLASALWHLPDERFSIGPIFDFRQLSSKIDFEGLPPDVAPDFLTRKLNTGALGVGLHFDSRDNPITPTQGVNAFVEGKFNSDAFGSDRSFEIYDLDVYAFHRLSPEWRLGFKSEIDAIRGDFPFFFAPAIDLRGVEGNRYQGSTVSSSEVELTRQLSDRWSILAFAGLGAAFSGQSRIFDDSGAIFAGGAGFRYRIARKQGIDLGVDVAAGPGGAIVYLQFGHAWAFGMD